MLIQAFRKKFIIPEFDVFAQKINEIYNRVQNQSDGKVCVLFVCSLGMEILVVNFRLFCVEGNASYNGCRNMEKQHGLVPAYM